MIVECGLLKVAAVGKPEQLVTSPFVMAWVEIEALDTNTSDIYWGNANVRAVSGGQAGLPLRVVNSRGDRLRLENVDLSTVWIDVRTALDGVTWAGQRNG